MAVKTTARKGIQHLAKETMSIKTTDFLEIINFIEQNDSKITPDIAEITEKSDGFSLRFGLDENDRFFIESSHSGPVFDEGAFSAFTKKKTGKTNRISKGYDDILKTLKNFTEVINILKKYNTPTGIKVICEAYYLPNARPKVDVPDEVQFVAIYYRRDRLGNWATFVLFEVQDGEGHPHPKSNKIISELKKVSTNNIMFDDSIIRNQKNITLATEIKQIRTAIANIEKTQKKKINDILTSRKKKDNAQEIKKKVKAEIFKYQKKVANKIKKAFIKGKWGPDMEGVVVKLANGSIFKIVNDVFTDEKARQKMERFKECKSFKDYYFMKEII